MRATTSAGKVPLRGPTRRRPSFPVGGLAQTRAAFAVRVSSMSRRTLGAAPMRFLRTVPTRRLLVLCAGIVAVAAGGTAIALAATGGGPAPAPKPLAQAVHDALTAPTVQGVSARIHFTNHLVDAGSLPEGTGGNPLIAGASGRLWATADGKLRLELQSDGGGGDTQVLVDGNRFTVLNGGTVYRGTLPHHKDAKQHEHGVPSVARIQQRLTDLMGHAIVSGAQPGNVAGQPAYTVRISPKEHAGMVGAAELAWDAATGVPLRAAVYAVGDASPVLELEATEISYGPIDSSVFAITPAPGDRVVDLSPRARDDHAKLPFTLNAPASLAGRPRSEVKRLKSGAVVTYGQGVDGIAVIETPARRHQKVPELDTPLGTVITFTRGGVDYVVLGSVPPA